MIGNGEILNQNARIVITTPADIQLTTSFQLLNKTNFPTLNIIQVLDGILLFNETNGEFTFLNNAYLTMNATLNFRADQASANLLMIPEFNYGAGWVSGVPRKKALTAIRADQITWTGEIPITKGTKLRFWFAEESGNVSMCTEILDPGGPLEVVLPFAIFYIAAYRQYGHLPIK